MRNGWFTFPKAESTVHFRPVSSYTAPSLSSSASSPRVNHQSQSSWRAATSTSTRTASFNGELAYEHLGTSTVFFTGAPKIKCTFFCVSVRQKNTFHIWPSQITNHKLCVCDTQTQMRYGNAPLCDSAQSVTYDGESLHIIIQTSTFGSRRFKSNAPRSLPNGWHVVSDSALIIFMYHPIHLKQIADVYFPSHHLSWVASFYFYTIRISSTTYATKSHIRISTKFQLE